MTVQIWAPVNVSIKGCEGTSEYEGRRERASEGISKGESRVEAAGYIIRCS